MRTSTSERLSHYETLGVDRNATEKQIKDAYKKLAMSLHPDKVSRQPNFVTITFVKLS